MLFSPFEAAIEAVDPAAAKGVIDGVHDSITAAIDAISAGVRLSSQNTQSAWGSWESVPMYQKNVIYRKMEAVRDALKAAADVLDIDVTPEAEGERRQLTRWGTQRRSLQKTSEYAAQTSEGVAYFLEQAQTMLTHVEALAELAANATEADSITNTTWAELGAAYELARPEYEQIETLAGCFEQEDSDIDARPYAFPLGEDDPDFRGSHKIERLIFRDRNPFEIKAYADGLVNSTLDLIAKLEADECTPLMSFEGMVGLAVEVPAKKISGEEEAVSGLSGLIFDHNVKGIWSQFEPFEGVVSAKISADAQGHKEALEALMEPLVTPEYKPYSEWTMAQKVELVQEFYGLASAIARAGSELGIFDESHEFYNLTDEILPTSLASA
mmetsp:Transcript_35809/g.102968  ORF Transcript_35809/g.102968 Transcript_35809/m.102968 type:complete len:384 (+) Transcript_35809:760-1911(+)